MEKILYFDCFAGISGDMTLGALIDLGLEPDAVTAEIRKLGVKGYEIEIEKAKRFSISGTDVKVTLNGETDCEHSHDGESAKDGGQAQDPPAPAHAHSHPHGHHHHDEKDRSLSGIVHIIRNSGLSERAKKFAISIFGEIAKAEAAVHGTLLSEVHFHEVGAVDSIVDIVGTAVCIDMLNVDRIFCSPVHEGRGFVNCQHGLLPIPVPAVAEMLSGSGISVVAEDIPAELVTPTGFGILKTLSERCGKLPDMLVDRVGYGFGKTETGRLNALRVILGTAGEARETAADAAELNPEGIAGRGTAIVRDRVALLETNLDNTSGEALGYAMERLMKAGALDVYFTPIQMKKNRPATMLCVLCETADAERLSEIIFGETETLGVRIREQERITLKREIKTVQTRLGEVRVKSVAVRGLVRARPEYEDCVKIAREHKLSFHEVYEAIKKELQSEW